LCVPAAAPGLTISKSPRATILLSDGTRLIAQDGWNSLALYQTADASVVHRFVAPSGVGPIALSPDEKLLLIACSDGSLGLWRVETGEPVWLKSPRASGLTYTYDATFAGNGERFAVSNQRDYAIVFITRTGDRIGAISFPPMQTNIMSVALGPDGTHGFLVDLGRRLHSFDVATGRPVDTGLTAAGPVRFSTDGRYVAFRNNNSGTAERLSVVRTVDPSVKGDFGDFAHIGHIRPASGGTFLVSAQVGERFDESSEFVGVQVWPDDGRVQEVWRFKPDQGVNERTDFLPRLMTGVSTDFRLVTRVTDLRSGQVTREIDNSANYRAEVLTYTSADIDGRGAFLFLIGGVLTVALVTGLLVRRRCRSRR